MMVIVYLAIVLHVVSGVLWRVPTKAPSSTIEQPTNQPTNPSKNKGPKLFIYTHCNINIIVPRNLSQESIVKLDLVVRQSLSDSTGIALNDITVQKHSFSELKSTRRLQWRIPTKSPSILQSPSISPSQVPTSIPSNAPSVLWRAPTPSPSLSLSPSVIPSSLFPPQNSSLPPSFMPTAPPSIVISPSDPPSASPIQWRAPTQSPSPTVMPSLSTTSPTTFTPSQQPSILPTLFPTKEHSLTPTQEPSSTQSPTTTPTDPTQEPSQEPSSLPTLNGGTSTRTHVLETIYLTVQNPGPFDTSTLNTSVITTMITHINELIHQAAMDGTFSTALVTHIQSSGNNEINNPTTIASASTNNQVLAFPPTLSPSLYPTIQPTQHNSVGTDNTGGGGGGGGSIGGVSGSVTHLVSSGNEAVGTSTTGIGLMIIIITGTMTLVLFE